MKKNAFNIRYS